MSKIILILNDITDIDKYSDVDGFIIPIKDLSINYNTYLSLSEFESIYNKIKDKDIFISLNKNMNNKDLSILEDTLKRLENYDIEGILYYDVALVNMKKRLNLKNNLVWAAEHLVCNYATINYWNSESVNYAYLSSEITKREIKEIKENTNVKLMANLFGYVPIFTSKRRLISNYLETFKKENNSDIYYMHKEGISYPLMENSDGTCAYSGHILNIVLEYFNLDIDYYVVNPFLIDNFDKVLDIIMNLDKNNLQKSYQELCKLVPNTDDGFINKDTIYKVK